MRKTILIYVTVEVPNDARADALADDLCDACDDVSAQVTDTTSEVRDFEPPFIEGEVIK